jgi:hypothetical protein
MCWEKRMFVFTTSNEACEPFLYEFSRDHYEVRRRLVSGDKVRHNVWFKKYVSRNVWYQ